MHRCVCRCVCMEGPVRIDRVDVGLSGGRALCLDVLIKQLQTLTYICSIMSPGFRQFEEKLYVLTARLVVLVDSFTCRGACVTDVGVLHSKTPCCVAVCAVLFTWSTWCN